MTIRPTIAFGPETKRTSWAWVGFDVGRELSKYFNVIFFPKNIKQVPQADLVFFIKNPPDNEVWTNLKHRSIKMVYCPIDNYSEESAIQKHAAFLGQCEAIFVHCSRLSPILKPYCKQVDFIEHYNRFGLSEMTAYKPSGYAVWVGTMENLPPVINWLQEHPLGLEIKFVTDYPVLFKDCITGALPIKDNHELIKWHPKVQNDIMSGAKVAFDIKGSSFNQMHKPPVKAQQFIVSGIPSQPTKKATPQSILWPTDLKYRHRWKWNAGSQLTTGKKLKRLVKHCENGLPLKISDYITSA